MPRPNAEYAAIKPYSFVSAPLIGVPADVFWNIGAPSAVVRSRWLVNTCSMPALAAVVPEHTVPLYVLFSAVANTTSGTVPIAFDAYWVSSVTVMLTPGETSAIVIVPLYTVIDIYIYRGFLGVLSALCKGLFVFNVNNSMTTRKICPACNQRPVAINYHRDDVVHYRTRCNVCVRESKRIPQQQPAWRRSGYTKKTICEKCGFKSKYPEQLGVFYIDGNLKNNNWLNLKTVCLNCIQEVSKSRLKWRQDPLVSDF